MAEPDIFRSASKFRTQLEKREQAATRELLSNYGRVYKGFDAEIKKIQRKMQTAAAAGETIKPVWFFQEERLLALERQVAAQAYEFAKGARITISELQRYGVENAEDHAYALATAMAGPPPPGVSLPWARLNKESLADIVGFTQDGSPLRELLDKLGPDASERVRNALVDGIAMGLGPREVARMARKALAGNLARALTIARTEMLRAYRETTRRSYIANADVLNGWIWHAHIDGRTCAACVAMHGSKHKVNERLDGHPNCRCAMVPLTKTWKELGFDGVPETQVSVPKGADVFAGLDVDIQRTILGPGKFEAWRTGEIELRDLVGRKTSKRWGTMRYERSLTDARAAAAKRGVKPKPKPKPPKPPRAPKPKTPKPKTPTAPTLPTPKPKPPTGPAGTPVSDALHLPGGTLKSKIEVTVESIDAVHGDGPLPRIPVDAWAGTKSTYGRYWRRGPMPDKIQISRAAPQPMLTTAHEIGHFIDHAGIGSRQAAFASANYPVDMSLTPEVKAALKGWEDAVKQSKAYDNLATLRDGPARVNGIPVDKKWLRYATSREELFARSYAQYVAEESGEAFIGAELEYVIVAQRQYAMPYTGQWEHADFAPIRASFNHLMEALGWRK